MNSAEKCGAVPAGATANEDHLSPAMNANAAGNNDQHSVGLDPPSSVGRQKDEEKKIQMVRIFRQSMIHLARPTVPPVAILFSLEICFVLRVFQKWGRRDGQTL